MLPNPSTYTKILGTGIGLPNKRVTNFDLEKIIDTSDQWIFERTGIRERRVCSTEGGEFPTDLAYKATIEALKTANITANDLDLIIFATTTPDYKLPNSACILQTKLGITTQCACMDIAAACTGFVYGLSMANAYIKSGQAKYILIVGSEMLSREVNWQDRSTCILFGDGCGVAIVGPSTNPDSDVLSSIIRADGTGKEFFNQYPGGAVSPLDGEMAQSPERYMKMAGREMFKVAVRALVDNALDALKMANLTVDDIDWMVPHQANLRIIEATGKRLGIDPKKVIVNIDKYANTSAATVPLAFHEAIQDGRIQRGQLILMDSFGAGLTSGAAVIRY